MPFKKRNEREPKAALLRDGKKNVLLLAHNWDYLPLRPYQVALHLSERGHNVFLVLPAEKTFSGVGVKQTK
ncbi:MAG: hypothetical protein M1368_01695, partial [Thaumarchaeota archaeon]|nr:hypothetical protein [Nitrososphaerota archaeon]